MDLRLPLLADANLHLGIAEEAIAEGSLLLAQSELEKADEAFEKLRELPDEGLFAAMLAPLEKKREKVAASVLRPRLEDGEPEVDPEQEEEPEDA